MLARFFNDYEEIKDSTNKNRMPKPEEAAAAEALPDAEGDVDMLKAEEDEDVVKDEELVDDGLVGVEEDAEGVIQEED